jgi:hypothetical protein
MLPSGGVEASGMAKRSGFPQQGVSGTSTTHAGVFSPLHQNGRLGSPASASLEAVQRAIVFERAADEGGFGNCFSGNY